MNDDPVIKTSGQMRRCDLCLAECEYEATTHLNLFLNGSEGIRVCYRCGKALCDIAQIIKESHQRLAKGKAVGK